MIARGLLAMVLGLIFMGFMAYAGWSKTVYSENEIRSVETSDEAKIRDLRKDEITQLRIALGRHAPTNRRADLYLRLAEIYIEAYRADYILEGRVHEKRLERGDVDKFIDHSHSQPNLQAGIQACKEILSYRIPFDKTDEILYFLGFNYSELGDRALGIKYFDQLTRRYPGSQYVGEAYKEMGEAAFDGGDFRRAQAYLELAAKKGAQDTLPRIYHKLAWSYYRTKQFGRAVDTMKLAIENAQKSGEKFLNLREEALRDMAIFMTETGRTDEAIAYFQSAASDKKFYPQVLEKLGKQYERNVEPGKATQVYESLLKTNPDSEAAFRVRVKLVDLDLRRGHFAQALGRLSGVQLPKSGDNDTQVAAQNLRAMVRRTATEHHEKYRKHGSKPDLEVAESYYSAYLATFLAADDSRHETPEIQMYLAEVKRDLGKSKEASELYRSVLESKDKRYAKEAGALWTASLSDAIHKSSKNGATAKATEPSALELEFIDAADRLQDALGETNEGRESALKAAQVLAGYKETQRNAVKRIRKIIARWPQSSQAVTAARLWMQLEAENTASDDIRDVMKELRENQGLMTADQSAGGKLKLQMADQETRLKIGTIANEEKKSDFASAGRGYETFAEETQTRDLAEKAYGNAITSYLKINDSVSVGRVANRWMSRYPKSPKAMDAVRMVATRDLIQGQFDQAAAFFQQLGKSAQDPDSLETAARIYEGMGDTLHAQQIWSAYIDSYPGNPHRWAVNLALARSYEAAKQDSQAASAYKSCMHGPAEYYAECGARLGDLYLRTQDIEGAKGMYRKVGASRSTASVSKKKKKSKAAAHAQATGGAASSPFVGYARFQLASLMEKEAKFDRLEMPEASLKKALNQRLNFLEPLSRSYTSAVEAGGPWAVAALARLANWATGFADELDNIAPPQGADSAAIARFHKNLEAISGPLRRKAVSTWMEGYNKALETEALSTALPELVDHLADARSSNPGRAQGARGKLRLAGVPADGGENGKAQALASVREKLTKNAQDSNAWVDYGNLLWGDGKPLLAKLAYERALSLNSRNPAALNNRGVVIVSNEGEEDWQGASAASILFRDALSQDEFFLPAKMNRAELLNYFRLFAKAKPLWDQVMAKAPSADAQDGLAVSLQGLGQADQAKAAFDKATDLGAPKSRFTRVYHDAARLSLASAEGGEKCLDRLGDVDTAGIAGFEQSAVEHLKKTCLVWKSEAKSK